MKLNGRLLVVTGFVLAMGLANVRGQEETETLGDKLKKLFHHSTPTPTPRRSHPRISPYPGASPVGTPTFSEEGTTPIPNYGQTPAPTATPGGSSETLEPTLAETPGTQYFEPVRPINPGPSGRTTSRIIRAPQMLTNPAETATPIPEIAPEEPREPRPMPSLPQTIPDAQSEASAEGASSAQSPTTTVTAPPIALPNKTPSAAISVNDIAEAPQYSADVRKLIDAGLDLARRSLAYKYASADPSKGGMDCSGFIFYVFTHAGIENVPRDASEQYAWVRKAGNFQAVLGHRDDTYELDGLKPGDLLFWANVSGFGREPQITQTMIYVGREKSTNQRLMIGASENSTYKGEKKSGVGLFDFKIAPSESESNEDSNSVFVGYGRFPALSE